MTKSQDLDLDLKKRWGRRVASARRVARAAGASTESLIAGDLLKYWRSCGIEHFQCFLCKDPSTSLGLLIPYREGGRHERSNYVPVCTPCDEKWSNLTMAQRIQYLENRGAAGGVFPPKPKKRTTKMKKPVTVAEWNAWLKEQKRLKQSG